MGTHPIFESDFDCLTEKFRKYFERKIEEKTIRFDEKLERKCN